MLNNAATSTTQSVNIFLVETPLQLLNAIEARHNFRCDINHIIVKPMGTGFSQEILDRLICGGEWDKVIYLKFFDHPVNIDSMIIPKIVRHKVVGCIYELQSLLNIRMINKLARSYSNVNYIFLGNYLKGCQQYMRHFANSITYNKLFILDDGTDILLINNDRKNININKSRPNTVKLPYRSQLIELKNKVLEWNEDDADALTYFTAYEIEPTNNDKVIKNTYEHLRRTAASSSKSSEVFFLGQCLVEDGYMCKKVYHEYLLKIKSYFLGHELRYIPHPRELPNNVEALEQIVDIKVRRLKVPIEYEVSVNGCVPKVLASFFCSALQSCRNILGEQLVVNAFYISPNHLMSCHDLVRSAYEYFEKSHNSKIDIIRV